MLLKLVFINKKHFLYKIKLKQNKNFLIASAPLPKNNRQKKALIKFLLPFENRIIYPCGFCEKDYPHPYPAFEIHCKNLLADFVALCKEKRPKIAVIVPNNLIKNKFYFDLSEYVGQIILIAKDEDKNLKDELLEHSGTVVEFVLEYEKNANNAEYLFMPQKKSYVF